MLCGNPSMIEEMTTLLGARGLRKHRVRTPVTSRSKSIGRGDRRVTESETELARRSSRRAQALP